MLSCKELRQIKLTDPGRVTLEMRLHQLLCGPCRGFSNKADALEKDVHDALRIDVPESLVERLVSGCSSAPAPLAAAESPRRSSRILMALRRIFGSRKS
jgi:hypothetical protein